MKSVASFSSALAMSVSPQSSNAFTTSIRAVPINWRPLKISFFWKAANDSLNNSTVWLPSSTHFSKLKLSFPSPVAMPRYTWIHSLSFVPLVAAREELTASKYLRSTLKMTILSTSKAKNVRSNPVFVWRCRHSTRYQEEIIYQINIYSNSLQGSIKFMKWWIIENETIINYAASQQFGFNIATLFACTVEISSNVHCNISVRCPVKRLSNRKQSVFIQSTEIRCLQISIVILSIRQIRFKSQGTSGLSILAWIPSTSDVVEVYIHVVVCTWRVHSWRNRCEKKKDPIIY